MNLLILLIILFVISLAWSAWSMRDLSSSKILYPKISRGMRKILSGVIELPRAH